MARMASESSLQKQFVLDGYSTTGPPSLIKPYFLPVSERDKGTLMIESNEQLS